MSWTSLKRFQGVFAWGQLGGILVTRARNNAREGAGNGEGIMEITIKRGLDLPLEEQSLFLKEPKVTPLPLFEGSMRGLMVSSYPVERFSLFVSEGDEVVKGAPLACSKACDLHQFVAPVSGKIEKIVRGAKRRLHALSIMPHQTQEESLLWTVPSSNASRTERLNFLSQTGILVNMRQRPFALLPDPEVVPRAIFINATHSSPYAPPVALLAKDKREEMALALSFLKPLTSGALHLTSTPQDAALFASLTEAQLHTIAGPHPSGTLSVQIHHIDPIVAQSDIVWTLQIETLLELGTLLRGGHLPDTKLVSIAGEGVVPGRSGLYEVPSGVSVADLMAERCEEEQIRKISGDPLTGLCVETEDFLHPQHQVFSLLKEPKKREMLHFFRLGGHKYSSHRAYLSGLLHETGAKKSFNFDVNNHGEPRAFIDGEIYQRVMPMQIPVLHLVKAVQAGDLELAQDLGLLEVDAEDFALASFVCPCKIEMVSIMEEALYRWGQELSC